MPMPLFLTAEGTNQGKIDGSCTIKGHEGQILVQGVEQSTAIPRNPQTGLATGTRVHGPLKVTKEVDKSSPKLEQALCTGEHMKSVVLDFYRINQKGSEEKYYTLKLENAIVVGIRYWMPNALDQANAQYGHMEDISFTFEKIIWTYVPDGIETEDSWTAPK